MKAFSRWRSLLLYAVCIVAGLCDNDPLRGPPHLTCLPGSSVGNSTTGVHFTGQAIHQITNFTKNVSACALACCGWKGCTSYSFAPKAPKPVHICQVGNPCCYLHKGQPKVTVDGNFTSGYINVPPSPAPAPTPPPPPAPPMPPGPHSVSSGSYNITGLLCQTSTIDIYYPTDLDNGPFPIISFAHGFGGGPIPAIVKSISSLGFVVVALASFKGGCVNEYRDQLYAIGGSRSDPSLHPALAHVDWSRSGLIGHSMGGFSTSMAASTSMHATQYNLKAAVMSHGAVDQLQTCKNSTADNQCPNGCSVSPFPMSGGKAKCTCCTGPWPGTPNITVPAMFTSGSADNTVEAGFLYKAFQACPARPKVFVNIAGQYHTTKGEQVSMNA